jgi:hypothetical protein
MNKLWKWLFGTRKQKCNINFVSNSVCDKHIWKAYDMPYYVRCAKCGKQWTKNEQTDF